MRSPRTSPCRQSADRCRQPNFVRHSLPDALVVFDHFHVIKMINDIINKIRRLVKQAYGYRDWQYFRLKVFDLPNLKPRDSDC